MDSTSREIYKSSLIKGLFNKYTAEKESLLAEITLLLEGDGVESAVASQVFEQKIEELMMADNMLNQVETMFTDQNTKQPKECCDKEGT